MNTAVVLSGESFEFGGTLGEGWPAAQPLPARSQVQRLFLTVTVIVEPSADIARVLKGSFSALNVVSAARPSARARAAWSKAGPRVFFAGSTRKNAAPAVVVPRYQKRPSGSHV